MIEALVSVGIAVVKGGIVLAGLLLAVNYAVLLERKLVGRMQSRFGPNRVGPFGLLQPLADAVKLMFKEDILPEQADLPIYLLAPAAAVVPALMAFAVIPLGPPIEILGRQIPLHIADLNVGLLFFFAMSSMGVYGVVLAGWSSGSKYSSLGGLRSSAQMVSYELAQGLAVLGAVMLVGSLSLVEMVEAQSGLWNVALQPLGFGIFFVASLAEVNRAPFDLPEAETELVAGFHTEYSSLKWALFFMAEYVNIVVVSSIAVTVFLGGWQGAFLPPVLWYLMKVGALVFLFIWIRATLPRLRYDQLMALGWKVLLPLSVLNLMVTALAVVLFGG